MNKYETLINILDQLRLEAPVEYAKYRPNMEDTEKLNQARSKSLIHLFLKVTFGLLTFKDREKYLTDGTYDGGIDAYYIDLENKKIFLIQSKFRNNSVNFENKSIQFDELLKMDVERIIDGVSNDESGNEYSGKIKQLQREIANIPNIGRFEYQIILLANMDPPTPSALRRLIGQFETTIYDYKSVYDGLVFPVISGTFYNQSELCISLNIDNAVSNSSKINYNVETEYSDCDITVVFVPTLEIGRILNKYRNSILKFNPRCYLELKSNQVNSDIHTTICSKSTNEFALFNNGITMLSDKTLFNEHVGKKGKAQVVIENPQIINGGQTAFTLSTIYEEYVINGRDPEIFENKEVLLKIITLDNSAVTDEAQKLNLIEAISKATNSQSLVENADRRSNDKIQVQLQKLFYEKYGIYYERKKGEYSDGVKSKYITRAQILDREILLRLGLSCDGQPSQARRSSSKNIFAEKLFSQVLNNKDRVDEYYFAYKFHQALIEVEKSLSQDVMDPYGVVNFGHALRYGKYAATFVGTSLFIDEKSVQNIDNHVQEILSKWLLFEAYAIEQKDNWAYFKIKKMDDGTQTKELNFDGYYKGRTVNRDLDSFFEVTLSRI
jgi:hypothetical protein